MYSSLPICNFQRTRLHWSAAFDLSTALTRNIIPFGHAGVKGEREKAELFRFFGPSWTVLNLLGLVETSSFEPEHNTLLTES